MYNVSDEFKNSCNSTNIDSDFLIYVKTMDGSDICTLDSTHVISDSIVIRQSSVSSSAFSLGSACTSELKMTLTRKGVKELKSNGGLKKNTVFNLVQWNSVDEYQSDDTPVYNKDGELNETGKCNLGYFYLRESKDSDYDCDLKLYDGMIFFDRKVPNDLVKELQMNDVTVDTAINGILSYLSDDLGYQFSFKDESSYHTSFDNKVKLNKDESISSYRDLLEDLAMRLVGFFTFSRDNKLVFRNYNNYVSTEEISDKYIFDYDIGDSSSIKGIKSSVAGYNYKNGEKDYLSISESKTMRGIQTAKDNRLKVLDEKIKLYLDEMYSMVVTKLSGVSEQSYTLNQRPYLELGDVIQVNRKYVKTSGEDTTVSETTEICIMDITYRFASGVSIYSYGLDSGRVSSTKNMYVSKTTNKDKDERVDKLIYEVTGYDDDDKIPEGSILNSESNLKWYKYVDSDSSGHIMHENDTFDFQLYRNDNNEGFAKDDYNNGGIEYFSSPFTNFIIDITTKEVENATAKQLQLDIPVLYLSNEIELKDDADIIEIDGINWNEFIRNELLSYTTKFTSSENIYKGGNELVGTKKSRTEVTESCKLSNFGSDYLDIVYYRKVETNNTTEYTGKSVLYYDSKSICNCSCSAQYQVDLSIGGYSFTVYGVGSKDRYETSNFILERILTDKDRNIFRVTYTNKFNPKKGAKIHASFSIFYLGTKEKVKASTTSSYTEKNIDFLDSRFSYVKTGSSDDDYVDAGSAFGTAIALDCKLKTDNYGELYAEYNQVGLNDLSISAYKTVYGVGHNSSVGGLYEKSGISLVSDKVNRTEDKVDKLGKNSDDLYNKIDNLGKKTDTAFKNFDNSIINTKNYLLEEIDYRVGNIQSSDEKIESLNSSVSNIESSISVIRDDISIISTDVDSLSTNVDSLNTNVDSLNTNVDSLSTNVDSLSTNVDSLNTNVSSVETEVASLNTRVTALENQGEGGSGGEGEGGSGGGTVSSSFGVSEKSNESVIESDKKEIELLKGYISGVSGSNIFIYLDINVYMSYTGDSGMIRFTYDNNEIEYKGYETDLSTEGGHNITRALVIKPTSNKEVEYKVELVTRLTGSGITKTINKGYASIRAIGDNVVLSDYVGPKSYVSNIEERISGVSAYRSVESIADSISTTK